MSRQGRRRPRNIINVKNFWNKEASSWGVDPRVTIRDHYFRLLEIDTICKLIKNKHIVFDIGCGTGFSSVFYAQEVEFLIGADYAEKMVDHAQKFLSDKKYFTEIMGKYALNRIPKQPRNMRFEVGDILDIVYKDNFFDAVITERVLINLPTYQQQLDGFNEVVRVLATNGVWLLVEVTEQGHKAIDELRDRFGLPKIEKYWHNLYLDELLLEKKAKALGLKLRKKMYFETYQFLTKVVHPLLVSPSEPDFMAGFNKAALIISALYPEYTDVKRVGLETFFKKYFRDLIKKNDPQKLDRYDKILPTILEKNTDFSGCSHQVLFVFDKKNER